jgi:anaerobic selenocysteine-containing dehydrogenase
VANFPSVCPLDCPDACSLDVRVEDGRVVAVDGSRDNPLTDGFICAKVRRLPEWLTGPDRLLRPAVRRGRKGEGRFEDVTWDEALARVAEKLTEVRDVFGGEAILPYSYGGSNGLLSQDTTDARLFRRLGSSRLLRTVCAAPSGAAALGLYGKMPGVSFEDYPQARLIVVWGANPSATGIHLLPKIYEAQRSGAKLVVLDPRATALARRSDLHLALRPGTDLPVALAVIRWLFTNGRADRTFLAEHATGVAELERAAAGWTLERAAEIAGVPAAALERFAGMYADASPAVIRCGWGPERNRNGGSAIAAVLALPAIAGKFGVRGGGYTMSNSAAWKLDVEGAVNEPASSSARAINMSRLGEALLDVDDPPVKCLFVYNSNALGTSPNQEKVRAGLAREDLFTVVFDSVLTDTARYADVVLPAASFLERRELSRGYGALVLQEARAVVPPVGQSRPNDEVFAELVHRTGLARAGDPEGAEELTGALLSGARGAELRGALRRARIAYPEFGSRPIQFVDVFPRTVDRRVQLFPAALDREAPAGLYGFQADPASAAFPLALISPASDRTITSILGDIDPEPAAVEIGPDDARDRGIRQGDAVRVYNELGEVRCPAKVNPRLRRGVVLLHKGLWARHTQNGSTANALAPDTLSDLGGGACFNDARVQVAPVLAAAPAPASPSVDGRA